MLAFVAVQDLLLPSLAYHFIHREQRRGTPRDEFLMLYSHHLLLLESGEVVERPVMILNTTLGAGPSRLVWFPSERQVAALWKSRLPR